MCGVGVSVLTVRVPGQSACGLLHGARVVRHQVNGHLHVPAHGAHYFRFESFECIHQNGNSLQVVEIVQFGQQVVDQVELVVGILDCVVVDHDDQVTARLAPCLLVIDLTDFGAFCLGQ